MPHGLRLTSISIRTTDIYAGEARLCVPQASHQLPIGAPTQLGVIRGSKPVAPDCGRVTWRSMYLVTHLPSSAPSRWSSACTGLSDWGGTVGLSAESGWADGGVLTSAEETCRCMGSSGAADCCDDAGAPNDGDPGCKAGRRGGGDTAVDKGRAVGETCWGGSSSIEDVFDEGRYGAGIRGTLIIAFDLSGRWVGDAGDSFVGCCEAGGAAGAAIAVSGNGGCTTDTSIGGGCDGVGMGALTFRADAASCTVGGDTDVDAGRIGVKDRAMAAKSTGGTLSCGSLLTLGAGPSGPIDS